MDAAQSAEALLVRITRCPIAARCLADEKLACSKIVESQHAATRDEFQVPEPWSGDISGAQILFVSSNPSIDRRESYPTEGWENAKRVDFFSARFDDRPLPWVDQKMRPLLATSPPRHRDNGTHFWLAARARASELLEARAIPGRDFALTEVVHCKSANEDGVRHALDLCVKTWLREVVRAAAAARVIVLFGAHARAAFASVFLISPDVPVTEPVDLEGRRRLVLQLPHPNAHNRRRDCAPLSHHQLEGVREFLR